MIEVTVLYDLDLYVLSVVICAISTLRLRRIFSLFRYLTSQREYTSSCSMSLKTCLSNTLCLCCGHRKGNYLTVLYLLTKVIFIVNVLAQLFLLNHFLGQDFHLYGKKIDRKFPLSFIYCSNVRDSLKLLDS